MFTTDLLLCLLAVTIVFLLFIYWYSGGTYTPEVTVKDMPLSEEIEIHYKVGRGDYCSCPAYYQEMKDLAPGARRIGIFYDNPKLVRTSNLRWIIGVVSAVNGHRQLDEFHLDRLRRYRCSVFIIPRVEKGIVTQYPCKTFLSWWLAKR